MRTLTAGDFDALHAAFIDAFSDYVVKLSPTREQLLEMFTRRGWVPEASVAELDGDAIVAFTVNGIHGDSGYDSGTGVAPSHRRRGLARELMDRSCDLLRERGCTRYVLEVLEGNDKAIALYRDCGFVETRRLQCWSFQSTTPATMHQSAQAHPEWGTSEPSWQNATHSIARARDAHFTIGNDDAYAIVFPSNGDVAQLAVRPSARRRGLGTQLLHAAAAIAQKPLRIMNVDDRDDGTARFLEAAGAQRTVRQIEMLKLL